MKNQKSNLVLLFISISTILNAHTTSDSTKLRKNEIAINLLPFINSLTGVDINQLNTTLLNINYKRVLKNHFALRVGFAISNNPENNLYNNQFTQVSSFGSQLKVKYRTNDGIGEIRGMIGFEKRWGKKIVQQFAGVDLGYSYYHNTQTEFIGVRDSLTNFSINNPIKANQNDSLTNYTRKNVNSMIITPFYGIRLNMSKRFFLSAQIGFDYKLIKHSITKTNNTIIKPLGLYSIDLNTNGVSTNIMLGFRF